MRALRQRLTLEADDAEAIVRAVFRAHPGHNFSVRLWDGREITWDKPCAFSLVFTEPETFRRCFSSGDPAQFAEAYVNGGMRVEGDLWAATSLASFLRSLNLGLKDKLRFVPKLVVPASSHSVRQDSKDVQTHYDLSDEFFRLFLDQKMVYSCAYFTHPEQSLEVAQERKLDLVCRKLGLQPGDRFLDVGCGWGALVIWAARHYGVHAHGITLSEHQVVEARRRVEEAGLDERVTIELRHYSDLADNSFDKIGSVGMYEHVGASKLSAYLRAMKRALSPGGLFLNHGITEPPLSPSNKGGAFIFRHVFPGSELSSVSRIQVELEEIGLEVLDVQSLRPHYALTLREWFRRFQKNRAVAANLVSERVLRTWDLYLAGCSRAFEDGVLGVHQVLAGKPDSAGPVASYFTRERMLLPD